MLYPFLTLAFLFMLCFGALIEVMGFLRAGLVVVCWPLLMLAIYLFIDFMNGRTGGK